MSYVEKNLEAIQRRIDYLSKKIAELPPESVGYLAKEHSALQWALQSIQDEHSSVNEARAFKKGQIVIMKNYKQILKKAVKTGNVSALQFMLDRTESWLEEAESASL